MSGLLAFALLWSSALLAQTPGAGKNPSIELNGVRLAGNGTGVRLLDNVKIYSVGLYLSQPATTLEQVVKAAGPKRLSMVMLRDVSADELSKLFTRGIKNNSPKVATSHLAPGMLRLGDIFSSYKRLSSGDTIFIDWVPGRGTLISVKGQTQGETISDPAFFTALMAIWLGDMPADPQLKEALLGRSRT